MAQIEIYAAGYCPFCRRAKALLEHRGLAYIEYDVEKEPQKRFEMVQRAQGATTIPQIFIDGRHLGGSDDLFALDQSGELAELTAL